MDSLLSAAEMAQIAAHAGATPRQAHRARQQALRERAQLEVMRTPGPAKNRDARRSEQATKQTRAQRLTRLWYARWRNTQGYISSSQKRAYVPTERRP